MLTETERDQISRRIHDYDMPQPLIGQAVLWFPPSLDRSRANVGFVVRASGRNVHLYVGNVGMKEAVRHIEDPKLKKRVREECLEAYLSDDSQAWELSADGTFVRVAPDEGGGRSAQSVLLAKLAESQAAV